jgi:hypothetical protein
MESAMSNPVSSKLRQHARILKSSGVRPLLSDLQRWSWSDDLAVGMKRDLTVAHTPPPAKVALDIVPLDDRLADRLFDDSGLEADAVLEMEGRRRMWVDRIPHAWVAVEETGSPVYVQWAIPGSEADLIREYFRGGFPEMAPDELLLEAAWATPAARGKRIMAEAMSRITESAAADHTSAITFVGVDNEPSIRGCRAAGFETYIQRRESWRLGHRSIEWSQA